MKAIADKSIQKILQIIQQQAMSMFFDKLKAVILYGSYARGDYTDDSDIDIMVLVDMDKYDLIDVTQN